jgi:hypothetical protein
MSKRNKTPHTNMNELKLVLLYTHLLYTDNPTAILVEIKCNTYIYIRCYQ